MTERSLYGDSLWGIVPVGQRYSPTGAGVELAPERDAHGLGPWHASVELRPVRLPDGRHRFNVAASWTGPPLPGAPPAPPGASVSAVDHHMVDTHGDALRLFYLTVDSLRTGRVPDLRALAKR